MGEIRFDSILTLFSRTLPEFFPRYFFSFFRYKHPKNKDTLSSNYIVLIEDDKNYSATALFSFLFFFVSALLNSIRFHASYLFPPLQPGRYATAKLDKKFKEYGCSDGAGCSYTTPYRWNLSSDQLYAAILTLSRSPRYAKNGK